MYFCIQNWHPKIEINVRLVDTFRNFRAESILVEGNLDETRLRKCHWVNRNVQNLVLCKWIKLMNKTNESQEKNIKDVDKKRFMALKIVQQDTVVESKWMGLERLPGRRDFNPWAQVQGKEKCYYKCECIWDISRHGLCNKNSKPRGYCKTILTKDTWRRSESTEAETLCI